ncbi:MAG: DUF4293 family protein [Bacteroidetes bacterium]|nr:DUF4293 family protein [Bacteroidota bacterium]
MLQRIQTVYLTLAALACAAMFILDVALVRNATAQQQLIHVRLFNSDAVGNTWQAPSVFLVIPVLVVIIGLLLIYTALKYTNRKQQMMFCKIILLLTLVCLPFIYFLVESAIKAVSPAQQFYLYAAYMPIVILLFTFFALRAIQRDDNLVRSADRLR